MRKFNHEEALELYNSGKTITQISLMLGVSESCVYEAIINLGAKIRKKMTPENKEIAKDLYESGSTLKQIAERLSVSQGAVSMTLKKLGVKTRTESRLSDDDREKILVMYESGIGGETIGEYFQMHPNYIRRIIKAQKS